MKRLLSIIILVGLAAVGLAQNGEQVLRINNFGGLNTRAGDFSIKPNEARTAHEIDWGRNLGSITKRLGYDSIATFTNTDSLIAIYGAYYSNGTQQLIVVTDSADVGYGQAYASPKGLAHFGSSNRYYVYTQVANEYVYIDSFLVETDTVITSYTSDASATWEEVTAGIRDTINNNTNLTGKFRARTKTVGAAMYWLIIDEDPTCDSCLLYGRDTAQHLMGTVQASTSLICEHWGITSKPSFAMYNDIVYMVNGNGKGMAYNGDVARSFPLNAPGEPTVIPLLETGNLVGEYRYVVQLVVYDTGNGFTTRAGYITHPVVSSGNKMMIKDLVWPAQSDTVPAPDSVAVKIYRTKGNPGPLDFDVEFYSIDSALAADSGGDSIFTTASALNSAIFYDTIGDGQLYADTLTFSDITAWCGRDSNGTRSYRYGSMTFKDSVVGNYLEGPDTLGDSGGVFYGIPEQVDTLGVVYYTTFIDTVTNVESDTSRGMFFWNDQDAPVRALTLYLPPIPASDSGIVLNLWRSTIEQITYTTRRVDTIWGVDNPEGEYDIVYLPPRIEWEDVLHVDSVRVTLPFLIGQVPETDSIFVDSIRFDSLGNARSYRGGAPPSNLEQIFTYNGRMFGTAGSRLYFSALDSAYAWGAFDYISLNQSDGDEITAAYPIRDGVVVNKNKSRYTVRSFVTPDSYEEQWQRSHISGFLGCIAPRSSVSSPLGRYALSDRGVTLTRPGAMLERTYEDVLVSAPLDNFDNLSTVVKSNAVGFYFDQKYMLCIGDTTYVYDERANAWSTWSLPFSCATLYGTEIEPNFMPGDTMYFIKPGDSVLYRYGSSETDNGTNVTVEWKSGALLWETPGNKSINGVEMAHNSDGTTDNVGLALYDEKDVSVLWGEATYSYLYLLFDTLDNRYTYKSALPNLARHFTLELLHPTDSVPNNTTVDGLDIYWISQGNTEKE